MDAMGMIAVVQGEHIESERLRIELRKRCHFKGEAEEKEPEKK